ncbi:D-alanyl-D-alanine carboxypeptidase/D-alanyl-D-alanine endopeptidase [Candidatus Thiothrix anitrata]|uniref:D-alanyl-D-alanine carboxypeptidase/D-alanyl-D-alanine-endopeptidase n=1 Tax=Candidatus Thiothrix anitrata TaxID=2823902 RepID=A0ABX7X647_9GAMM|nr:D-alanyl-D-alanine carboxypeptidase/D-alanyl-D-alanine-endopeptidase [Candidatus Thiothrix anitrata]QTR51356.1 D-alanyl-D-alanine carboxypeptidase/D-alanyl-D-alanine-endopeptidase [Candidatus Thiothrix anitrata]
MLKTVFLSGLLSLFTCSAVCAADAPVVLPIPVVTPPQPAELTLIRQQQTTGLPDEIREWMQQKAIPEANLSAYIRDLNANAPLLIHNENVPRNPASTMKLVTTWVALKLLGPAYTWKTESWLRGELKDGVLTGDLILKGYGDPFLTDEAFREMLHDLRLKGLKEIRGNLVVDNSYFNLPLQDPAAFDGEPSKVYNATPSALMYNFQAVRLLFEPDELGKRVKVTPFPTIPGLQVDNQLKLSSGGCKKAHYRPGVQREGNVVKLVGSYATGCGQNFILRVLSSPEENVFHAFRDVWHSQGGVFNGQLQTGVVQQGDLRFHTHESRTLGEQIRFVNKWSNNVMARHLFLTAGAHTGGEPATLEKARAAMSGVLEQAGIQLDGMVVENGSGLSRQERMSTRQLGQLLEAAWRDPYMPEFMASMPVLGEDGTLAKRLDDTELRGRSHMKTGTLKDSSAIAGYMLTRSGKRLVVALVYNGNGAGSGVQDALLEWAFEQ